MDQITIFFENPPLPLDTPFVLYKFRLIFEHLIVVALLFPYYKRNNWNRLGDNLSNYGSSFEDGFSKINLTLFSVSDPVNLQPNSTLLVKETTDTSLCRT